MIVDVLIAVVLLISTAISFFRGFIRETLTIMGVVGGSIAAYVFGPMIKPFVSKIILGDDLTPDQKFLDLIPYGLVLDVVSYGSIFVFVVIALTVLSFLISKWAKDAGLGAVDRSLGVVFGVLRSIIIIMLLYLPFYFLLEKETRDDWMKDSYTYVYLESGADWIVARLPQEEEDITQYARDKAQQSLENIGNSAREKLQNMEFLAPEDSENGGKMIFGDPEFAEKALQAMQAEQQKREQQEQQKQQQEENGIGYRATDRETLEQLFRDNGMIEDTDE